MTRGNVINTIGMSSGGRYTYCTIKEKSIGAVTTWRTPINTPDKNPTMKPSQVFPDPKTG
jgi:hypothetical protein